MICNRLNPLLPADPGVEGQGKAGGTGQEDNDPHLQGSQHQGAQGDPQHLLQTDPDLTPEDVRQIPKEEIRVLAQVKILDNPCGK